MPREVNIKDTIKEFLFYKFDKSSEFSNFAKWEEFEKKDLPTYIQDNLHPKKELREYQVKAIKRLIFLFENGGANQARHLLFNMATGSGKTLVMAGLILYLYEKGYRNFLFLVPSINILEQAKDNFTAPQHYKYLFNKKVSFNGRSVSVNKVSNFNTGFADDINIMFMSVQLLYKRFKEAGENRITKDDFINNNIVILSDEAHHANGLTKKSVSDQTKTEMEEEQNWESVIMSALNANDKNRLFEFTATAELSDYNINEKYRDKLLYRYSFIQFNKDKYSKNVGFLFNNETHIERQRRLLIVNAVALSEYRKILFENVGEPYVNPIVLVKSKRIKDSEEDKKYFNSVIDTLNVSDFDYLKSVDAENDPEGIISSLFQYVNNTTGKMTEQDFIDRIKNAFAEHKTLIYNSKQKQNKDALQRLDDQNEPRKIIRTVFSVNALNEGWDVLSLYDIIHFDIAENKKVSMSDIQFIGRGSRYCPFEVKQEEGDLFGVFEPDRYKRKFDKAVDSRKILDYFYYHFVETGNFREKLEDALKEKGILDMQPERVPIQMKDSFKESQTYKNGFVLQNSVQKREPITEHQQAYKFNETVEIERVLQIRQYKAIMKNFDAVDEEEKKKIDKRVVDNFFLKNEFSDLLIRKALMRAENGFFRLSNLSDHIPNLKDIDDFIKTCLTQYKITYYYHKDKQGDRIEDLPLEDQLEILVEHILPGIRKSIEKEFPTKQGTTTFRPFPIRDVFSTMKYVSINSPQTDNENVDLRLTIQDLDWYAYDENYGTSYEKAFVVLMNEKMDALFEKYKDAEIFLVRNELDYWLYSTENGQRFAPDYLLFINDWQNKNFYYQCIFEPKDEGRATNEKNQWKEDMLKELESITKISYQLEDGDKKDHRDYFKQVKEMGYKEIKNIGFSFFNPENKLQFEKEFEDKLLKQQNSTS